MKKKQPKANPRKSLFTKLERKVRFVMDNWGEGTMYQLCAQFKRTEKQIKLVLDRINLKLNK